MAAELPPQVQNQIAQLQELQNQHQATLQQKQQLEGRLRELRRSLEEIEDAEEDAPIFRSVGGLLVKVKDRDALLEELTEEKETISVRLNSLKKQEEKVKSKMEQLQSSLQKALSGAAGAGPGGPGAPGGAGGA